MLKKVVGTLTAASVVAGSLGMGYPQEKEEQKDTAYLVYSEAVTRQMAQQSSAKARSISSIQAQGVRSIAKHAEEEARVQEAAMPLVRNTVELSKRKTSLTEEELLLLQKVVSAEARGESSETQYTVACVVLNRMESEIFPDSLSEVVSQKGQFECVQNGAIYNVPITDSVVNAVNLALDNNTVDSSVLWFRSGRYHGFHDEAFQVGRMYFSQI